MPFISEELAAFLGGHHSTMLATRNAAFEPACARAFGLHVLPSRDRLTFFMPERTSVRVIEDLRSGSPLSVVVNQLHTHRSVQLKGSNANVRPAREDERTGLEQDFVAFVRTCELAGLPSTQVLKAVRWPALIVEVTIDAVYEQTPGPGAGEALDAKRPA